MRKITQATCAAFQAHEKKSQGNTVSTGDSLQLHGNTIAEWRNGELYISHCGWPTVTTKERLNGLRGVKIHQERGRWYLNGKPWNGDMVKVAGFTGNVSESEEKKRTKITKAINAYVAKINHPLPKPSVGDCWLCCMKVTSPEKHKGMAWGGVRQDDHYHLTAHIGLDPETGTDIYIHGSLIVNAMREAGYQDAGIGLYLSGMGAIESVRSAVRRYLKKRLTPSTAAV